MVCASNYKSGLAEKERFYTRRLSSSSSLGAASGKPLVLLKNFYRREQSLILQRGLRPLNAFCSLIISRVLTQLLLSFYPTSHQWEGLFVSGPASAKFLQERTVDHTPKRPALLGRLLSPNNLLTQSSSIVQLHISHQWEYRFVYVVSDPL